MLVENIPESQPHIEGERCGLNAELRFVNRVERIAKAGIQRDPVVISEAVANLGADQTTDIHRPVRRIRPSRL